MVTTDFSVVSVSEVFGSCPISSFSGSRLCLPPPRVSTFHLALGLPTRPSGQIISITRCSFSEKILGVCCLCKTERKRRHNWQTDHFVVYFEDDTIVQQVVVEAGKRRAPQHPPLHSAWHVNFTVQCFQILIFLLYQGELLNPLVYMPNGWLP